MPDDDDFITIPELQLQVNFRKKEQDARNKRMDYWHLMYLLVDEFQLSKDQGLIRFTSNEPRTVVDLAVATMSRHPFKPRIPMEYAKKDEDRSALGQIERGIKGAFQDIDRQMNRRGLPSARKTAAWQLLLRGWAANRLVLRDDARPIDYEPWDMRFVLPEFSRRGLESIIYETVTTLGDAARNFPDFEDNVKKDGRSLYEQDLAQWVVQYEFWDRYQSATAVSWPKRRDAGEPRDPQRAPVLIWAEEPYAHELKDELDEPAVPVIIVPSHGLPFNHTPTSSQYSGYRSPADMRQLKARDLPIWKRPGGWTADQGRSILAAVEDSIPQFNELTSLIWQIMDNEAFGTLVIKTRTGGAVPFEYGGGATNFMRVGETVDKLASMTASPDTYHMLQFIQQQVSQGTLDQQLLRGLQDFSGSGFLRSQMENAALNALAPWLESYEFWATENAQSLLNQMRQGGGRKFTVWAEGSDKRLFKMEFGPDDVKDVVYVEMKAKPALPDDLAVRVNIAAQLANPARPLASIQTIFDRVLEWEDAEREKELIFDDLADTDPVVVLLRLRTRMLERGLPELAEIFGKEAFAKAFIDEVMRMQMIQQATQTQQGGGIGPGAPEGGAPPMSQSSTAPPESYGVEPGREGTAPTPAGAAEGAM